MSGFLDDMARSSAARVAEAIRHESASALERRARRAAPSNPLRLSASGVDVIAELKLRSPAAGRFASGSEGAGGAEPVGGVQPILIGVNCRDFQTLTVVRERFAALAPLLPAGWPAVAESGVASGEDARRMQQLGYRLALIGTALMASGDPSQLLRRSEERRVGKEGRSRWSPDP